MVRLPVRVACVTDCSSAGADHVDDGIDAADFVEVDLIGRPAVQSSLGFGQSCEHGLGPFLNPGGQACLGHQALDVSGGAHH